MIFGVYTIIYWLKDLIDKSLNAWYQSAFAWTIGNGILLVASLSLLFITEKIVRKRSFSTVGFKLPVNKEILTMFAGLIGFYAIGGIILLISSGIGSSYFSFYFVSAIIVVPLAEEIVFRGLIQTRFEAGLGTVKSWILSGLLFGGYHFLSWYLIEGKMITLSSQFSLISLTFTFLFGMFTGIIFTKTRSLLPPFLLHAMHNFITFFF